MRTSRQILVVISLYEKHSTLLLKQFERYLSFKRAVAERLAGMTG